MIPHRRAGIADHVTMRTEGEFEVYQDVLIMSVEVGSDEITVDIYGGDGGICGAVTYEIPDEATRTRRASTLQQWCDEATPLAYVRRGDSVALLDEHALFAGAMDT
jgi:hypothetical protein